MKWTRGMLAEGGPRVQEEGNPNSIHMHLWKLAWGRVIECDASSAAYHDGLNRDCEASVWQVRCKVCHMSYILSEYEMRVPRAVEVGRRKLMKRLRGVTAKVA